MRKSKGCTVATADPWSSVAKACPPDESSIPFASTVAGPISIDFCGWKTHRPRTRASPSERRVWIQISRTCSKSTASSSTVHKSRSASESAGSRVGSRSGGSGRPRMGGRAATTSGVASAGSSRSRARRLHPLALTCVAWKRRWNRSEKAMATSARSIAKIHSIFCSRPRMVSPSTWTRRGGSSTRSGSPPTDPWSSQ